MAFSYSFHLSSKSHSVGTSGKVSQVSKHNLREYKSADYDRSQIEILTGSDTSILEDVKKIYHQEFDEALERYNEGKRSDRQIGDYLNHVSNSRSDVACEIIIQVGDKNFWEDKSLDERKQMTYIFQDQLRSLEKLVPEFKVASAIIHYDEASPHMHVVGVPVATGYKKGMEKQVAKTKVFTADRLSYLQDRMRENAEKGMRLPQNQNLFAEMELKEKELGRNKDIPKASLTEFYQLQRAAVELEEENTDRKKELEELDSQIRRQSAVISFNDIKIEKKQSILDMLDKDVQKAENRISDLQTDIYTLDDKKSILGANLKELDGTLKIKKDLLADLDKSFAIKEKKISILESKIQDLQNVLDKMEQGFSKSLEKLFSFVADKIFKAREIAPESSVLANKHLDEAEIQSAASLDAAQKTPENVKEITKKAIEDHVEDAAKKIEKEVPTFKRDRGRGFGR